MCVYVYVCVCMSHCVCVVGTRGNGSVGVDVTSKAAMMSSIPQYVAAFATPVTLRDASTTTCSGVISGVCDTEYSSESGSGSGSGRVSECGSDEFTVEVRGEVYLSSEDFLKLQSLSQSTDTSGVDSLPYSLTSSSDVSGTPRNRAAGILRLKDDTSLTTALLQFSAYSVVVWPTATSDDVSFNTATSQYTAHTLRSQTHTLTLLKECGFHVAECSQTFDIKCASEGVMGVDELLRHLLTMESKRSDLPYDTDGLVLKVLYYTTLHHASVA